MRLPSPALAISVIALFVALGGTSYAVTQLPKNSVGSEQLKDGAVQTKDINTAAVASLAGKQGPPGAAGANGSNGAPGQQGPRGETGPAGSGAAGAQGTTGATGAQGVPGLDGRTILSGVANPTSGLGANGDFYINTSTSTLFGPKSSGVWPSGVSLIGATGPAGATGAAGPAGAAGPTGATGSAGTSGADGRTILSGASNPASGVGSNGDFYINTSTSTIFGPKASGAWPIGVSLVGATGPSGISGAGAPRVLDGSGTQIGDLISVSTVGADGVEVTARIGGLYWVLDTWTGRVVENGSWAMYKSNNCSGPPVLAYPAIGTIRARPAGALRGQIFVTQPDGSSRAYQSPSWHISTAPTGTYFSQYQVAYAGGPGTCQPYFASNPTIRDVQYVDDLVEVSIPTFTPPLTIG